MNIQEKIKNSIVSKLNLFGFVNERDFVIKLQRYLGAPMDISGLEIWSEGLIFESSRDAIYNIIVSEAFYETWPFSAKIYHLGETKMFSIEFLIRNAKIKNIVTQTLI